MKGNIKKFSKGENLERILQLELLLLEFPAVENPKAIRSCSRLSL